MRLSTAQSLLENMERSGGPGNGPQSQRQLSQSPSYGWLSLAIQSLIRQAPRSQHLILHRSMQSQHRGYRIWNTSPKFCRSWFWQIANLAVWVSDLQPLLRHRDLRDLDLDLALRRLLHLPGRYLPAPEKTLATCPWWPAAWDILYFMRESDVPHGQ